MRFSKNSIDSTGSAATTPLGQPAKSEQQSDPKRRLNLAHEDRNSREVAQNRCLAGALQGNTNASSLPNQLQLKIQEEPLGNDSGHQLAMKVLILTGAGISAESGIPTFRGSDGLWEGHRVEEVATPTAFQRNPALVQEFYNQRRRRLLAGDIQPNAAHFALAEFES